MAYSGVTTKCYYISLMLFVVLLPIAFARIHRRVRSSGHCASGPCDNGGTCTNHGDTYSCQCIPGYTGDQCQTAPQDCASGPCKNGGTCTDHGNTYTCQCHPEFIGDQCQTEEEEEDDDNYPCTEEAIAAHEFYHPYPSDEHKFIQCDDHGNQWILSCPPPLVWDQSITACNWATP